MYILVLLFSFSLFAAPSSSELAASPKWIKLLHYKKNLFGNYVSEADGQGFFLHAEGRTNPLAELEKSLEVFAETTTPNDDHGICRFPLRYKWLNKELGMPWKANFEGCTKYVGFFSKLAAKRASLIFSSYYLTNPNSAFGHTLLRLSRFDDANETEMLDYGINYAAKANENNPLLYAWKGLFGGFIGEYTSVPYYYKIREYSNFEFRDLWSYDLKFSMVEVLEMVDHIWELGQTHFDYFYFKENCSYHLLGILEVARPSLNLTDRYELYTIPADTVRLLHQEGLIDLGKRRESTYSKLVRLSDNLKNEDLKLSKQISKSPKDTSQLVKGIPDQKAAAILDVSLEAFDYDNFEKILLDDPQTKAVKDYILRERARNPIITQDVFESRGFEKDSPANSHSPTRLTIAENYNDKMGKASRFEFRAALHDLLDPLPGSLPDAQLELAKLSVEVKEQNYGNAKFIFDHVSIFNIKNFPEQNFWSSPLSWEVDIGGKQLKRLQCFDCPGAFVLGAAGNTIQLAKNRVLMSFLLNGELNIQSQFAQDYRVGLGPKFYTRFKINDRWATALNSVYHFNTYEHKKMFQDYEWLNELELRHYVNDRWTVALKGGGTERNRQWMSYGELGLQYFYE